MPPTEPMLNQDLWSKIIIPALGVAINASIAGLAIWGDFLKSWLSGPRLSLSLLNPDGERTTWTDGVQSKLIPTRYYHLKASNNRRHASARNTRVVMTGLARAVANGPFVVVPLTGTLQLTWQFPNYTPLQQTLGPDQTCDLGYLRSDSDFELALCVAPNNLHTSAKKGERIRVELRAVAENAESAPLFVEVAWDGAWVEDTVEMRQHLVVKEVASLIN